MVLTATFACALLLLLLHATTTTDVTRTRGATSLFAPLASADDTVSGLPGSADGILGIGLPAAADDNFGLPASVVIVAENTVEHARQRLRVALSANSGPNCRGQFSPHRFAFLFLPGNYELDLEVGFYMQAAVGVRVGGRVGVKVRVRVKAAVSARARVRVRVKV